MAALNQEESLEAPILRCYIYKFASKIELNSVKSIQQNISHKALVLAFQDGSAEIVKLSKKSRENICLANAKSFQFRDGDTGEDLQLYVVSDHGSLDVCTVAGDTLVCQAQTDIRSLLPTKWHTGQSASDATSVNVEVAGSWDISILLCINEELLQIVQHKEGRFNSVATIQLPVSLTDGRDSCRLYQVTHDILVVMALGDIKLYFYTLTDGSLQTTLNLDFLDVDMGAVQTWEISDDLRIVVFILHTGDIQWIDLQLYISHNPTAVKRETGSISECGRNKTGYQALQTGLSTCKFGDVSWRKKLISLHDAHTCDSESQWKQKIQQNTRLDRKYSHKSKTSSRKLSSFQVKERRGSVAPLAHSEIACPEGLHGYSVGDVCIGPGSLCVVYTYNGVSVLCLSNVITGSWTKYRFKLGEVVLLASNPGLPHLVVMETHLMAVLTDLSMDQEYLISELMMYAGVGVSDAVCHINQWGSCSIPMHTLEIGLKHRQLDTVTIFMKSKEDLFSTSRTIAPSSPQSPLASPSWAPQYNHSDNLNQLEPALHLLLQTVRGAMGDKHSRVFGKQVLDITIDFLYGLLLDSLAVSEGLVETAVKHDLQNATEKILQYIEETREYIRQYDELIVASRAGSVSAGSLSTTSVSNISIDAVLTVDVTDSGTPDWDTMDIEDVVRDGIMRNRIPRLQKFLTDQGEWARGDYSSLKVAGLRWAVTYIRQGQMAIAKDIIARLGLSVMDELWEIALYTLDMALCNSILEELQGMAALHDDQVAMVTFLRELNTLYPCRNFEQLRDAHPHVKDSETAESHRLKLLVGSSPTYDLTAECSSLTKEKTLDTTTHDTELTADIQDYGDITGIQEDGDVQEPTVGGPTEGRSVVGYSEAMLAWLQDWDSETRDLVRLDALMYTPGSDLGMFSKDVIWSYLQSHNMADVMVAWIHNSYHDNHNDSQSWPVSTLGSIPPHFVDHLELCPEYTKDKLLQAFSSHGVFRAETIAHFPSLLQQLNRVGGVLMVPHPLQQCPALSVEQFHLDLIQYCVEQGLPHMLWSYCTMHKISADFLHDLCPAYRDTWLPMFTCFYAVTRPDTTKKSALHQASLSNAVAVWGEDAGNVGAMLQCGHVLAALATLVYTGHQLHQVTFLTQQMDAFDGLSSETVERAIQMYPKLRVSLFPAMSAESPHSDVCVYQLLTGNAPFDPSRLFGWQTTNTCIGEDAVRDMPYFSQGQLVSRYAYSEQLRYTYYLKQGRPTFAFVTFLADSINNGSPNISNKRIMVAMGTSLCVGVKNFHNPQASAACVIFQELLGQDSLLLRTYIQVGCELLTHRNNAVTGTMDKRREQTNRNEAEIVEMLLECLRDGRKFGPIVLQSLEAAILAGTTRDRLALTNFECSQRWTVAVLFCHLLRLPYTTVFLEACAQTNKWLPFIWFSQIHQYPKEQLQNLLHMFRSATLQEHLRYVLANADLRVAQEQQRQELTRVISDSVAKDVRSTLYSRIGLTKEMDSDTSSAEDDVEPQSLQSVVSLTDDDDIQITYEGSPGDVFGVVFAAQSSRCPWKTLLVYSVTLRNPLFAELAACLTDAVTLPCLCGWLAAMMDATEHARFLEHHGKSIWRFSLQTLDAILDLYVKQKWGSVLVTGFDIFQQNSPLLPFLQFYAEFTERKNYNNCRLLLAEFKESVFQFHHEKSGRSHDQIGDSDWLERMTYRIIQYMLTSTPSVYEVTQLLKILDSESITLTFTKEDPDFRKQLQLMEVITSGEIRSVNFVALLTATSEHHQTECQKVVRQLMDRQAYDEARKFAQISGTVSDHITIAQLDYNKARISSTKIWQSTQARFKFYRECANRLKQHNIAAATVAAYFQGEVDASEDQQQKAYLYSLCLDCVRGDNANTDVLRVISPDVYRKMWLCRMKDRVNFHEQSQTGAIQEEDVFADLDSANQTQGPLAKKELMCFGKMPHTYDKPKFLSDKEVAALKELVGELLRMGKICEACRVVSEFSLYSKDLAIILTCIRLSLGMLSLENMEPDMLHLLRIQPGDTHRLSIAAPVALLRNSSAISLSNIQPELDILSEENEEKIAAMECLLRHCDQGSHTCRRVITAFKIASILCIGYDDVITGDDFHILKSLLKTKCSGRFRLASDFLATSSLSPAEIAGFLSDAILQSYRVSIGVEAGNQELFFHPGENFSDFHQIVRLCQEPSLLGDRLLDAVAMMAGTLEQTSDKVLTLQTEVLIRSHECHTAACNMEGISNILRAARVLTAYLEAAQEFQLMTRLLTGIGRYNEMIYIFDALQHNHQFELLLGKGMEKEAKLKTAILDYLKRYHPMDSDTYTMVALKFMMYREIAQLLEDNANKLLDSLKGKPLENNSETQQNLQKIAQFLTEAAESYIKENCLRHAQSCVRKARLVALQLKHLSANQQFINLTTKGANLLIADHPVFTEAYIVSEAYGQRESWPQALCNNVILGGDMKYLQELRAHVRLTPTLIQEAVHRYQSMTERSPNAPNNVKKLIPLCKDVKTQYKIAKELGLRDVVSSLEKGEARAFIMDFTASLS